MQWIKKDLATYHNAAEYVDTLIIPLTPFQITKNREMEKSAFQKEVLDIFTNAIEKELAGRVMLTPSYHYLESKLLEEEISRVNHWVDHSQIQPFRHVFFITFDPIWKRYEQKLAGTLLWLPGITEGDTQSKEMKTFIGNQVKQVSIFITSYWQQ